MRSLLFFVLVFFLTEKSYAQPCRNLVLEGGGIRGIAYTGAIKVLEEQGITDSLQNIAGTSVGAVAATLMSVGYTADELKQLMFSLKVQTFNDGSGIFIGGQRRTRKLFGWYRGDALEKWIGQLVKARTGDEHTTFAALHALALKDRRFKDLYVTATNLSQQKAETFSYLTYPDMEIKTAVRTSISVPLYFSAVFLDSNGRRICKPSAGDKYNVFVDGGILANYPLGLFDTSAGNSYKADDRTLGLKLERPEQIGYFDAANREIAPYKIRNFRSYIAALYNLIIEKLNRDQAFAHEDYRTIYISTSNMNPRVRHITFAQKELLYDNGRLAAQKFFLQEHTH